METTLKQPISKASGTKTTRAKAAKKAVSRSRSRDNNFIKGYPLVKKMKTRALEIGENSDAWIIESLGITRGYWNSLCNGHRAISGLVAGESAAAQGRRKWVAELLNCSELEIRVLAGDIGTEEMVAANTNALWLEMEKVKLDPRWRMFAPENETEWDALPINIKILLVGLYREITDRDIKKTIDSTTNRKRQTVETL